MLNLLLQVWGGAFYLLNKLFFSQAERAVSVRAQQSRLILAWSCYLIGLPPWVFIFISERNWIAAAVETSGVPAMIMGLIAARQGEMSFRGQAWLDYLARLMVVVGLGLSIYDFGGLTTLNQVWELGIAAGFLLGTYLLARQKAQGYFWFVVGNISAAALMLRQGYFVLMTQQLLSLVLVVDAYWVRKRKREQRQTTDR